MATSVIHRPAYRAFLRRIRAARERVGMTQAEVAKKLRKPQSYVSKTENGERRMDPVELLTFAKLYKISIWDVLPGFPK